MDGRLQVQAFLEYIACMRRTEKEQLTIRSVPRTVGTRLRERARREGKSLNTAAVGALIRGIGLPDLEGRFTDLDDLVGSWIDDPGFDHAIEEMDSVDPDLWK
jgi:hypothetical protein